MANAIAKGLARVKRNFVHRVEELAPWKIKKVKAFIRLVMEALETWKTLEGSERATAIPAESSKESRGAPCS